MIKKLYFNTKPEIKCFLHHAYVFGVIEDKNMAERIAINNYLQIYISEKNWFDFYTPDFIHDARVFERKYLTLPFVKSQKAKNTIIDIIIRMIKKGYYVQGTFNEFYVPFSWHHNMWDFNHKFLINGFDDEKEIFNIIGYYNGQLSLKEISFDDFFVACVNTVYEK